MHELGHWTESKGKGTLTHRLMCKIFNCGHAMPMKLYLIVCVFFCFTLFFYCGSVEKECWNSPDSIPHLCRYHEFQFESIKNVP